MNCRDAPGRASLYDGTKATGDAAGHEEILARKELFTGEYYNFV
ncbi:MAG: hypothetical protein AAB332_07075 [Planctomycetota bacterium]